VPNIQIYLYAIFHNFLRHLSIFPEFISFLCFWKICRKEKGFFLHRLFSPCWPNSRAELARVPPTLCAPLPVGLGALVAPPVRDRCLCAAHLSGFSSPKSSLPYCACADAHRQIRRRRAMSHRLAPLLLQLPPRLCTLQHRLVPS
jgi:hypothetical protein